MVDGVSNKPGTPALGWTFTESGQIDEVAEIEIKIARRETGQLDVIVANETTVDEAIIRIEKDRKRLDLLVAKRNWVLHPAPSPMFDKLLNVARKHGLVVHIIGALGPNPKTDDPLNREAWQSRLLGLNPMLGPPVRRSGIERKFGELLEEAGLSPVPQKSVAQYFLDFAVIGSADELPVRLDIEVDGRYWHEELPGRHGISDKRRDTILRRLGWRPVRFWTDEIENDTNSCISLIRKNTVSGVPTGRNSYETGAFQ